MWMFFILQYLVFCHYSFRMLFEFMYKTDYEKNSCSVVGLRGYFNRLTIEQHSKINQDIF